MVSNEGEQILIDTATEAQEDFARLRAVADTGLDSAGINPRIAKILSLKEALISEIENPRNCGEGPEARRIIAGLQRELPGFLPLSGSSRNCEDNEEIIRNYNERIDGLIERADWNDRSLSLVKRNAAAARSSLDNLRGDISSNYSPERIGQYAAKFEEADSVYRDLRNELSSGESLEGIPASLDLVAVRSLGDVTKIISLLLSRWDYPTSWIYLGLAALFDFMIVSLFMRTSALSRSPAKSPVFDGGM
jgi:hypothetical protein